MSLQQWSLNDLKDKDGNPPPPEIFNFINEFDKKSLFPCTHTAADLMILKNASITPREMNSFIIFRRQISHVAKQMKKFADGKTFSRATTYIWRGASRFEKDSYHRISKELKDLHYKTYPSYSYERRKRKTAEDDFSPDTIKKRRREDISETSSESYSVQALEAECELTLAPLVPLQEQVNGEWFDSHNLPPTTLHQLQLVRESFNNSYLESSQVEHYFYEPNYTIMSPQDLDLLDDDFEKKEFLLF